MMGAWAHDAFGNDTACDWVFDLKETDDMSLVESTIDRMLENGDDYLDASDAEEALAAIEAVARLRGNFGVKSAYSEPLDEWVMRTQLKPSELTVQKALEAIERIAGKDSELKELWEESGDYDIWIAAINELKGRVLAEPKPVAEST
jgi:hypothetical protein